MLHSIMTTGSDGVPLEDLLSEAGFLRRLAATLVSGEDVEDLFQETWRTALEHPPRSSGPLRPWLARVARNLASNLRRGARHRRAREEREGPDRADLDPAVIAEQLDAQKALTEAVQRLEEPLRTTVVLRWFRGLDSSRIATLQGVPAGTVRWRLKQALERLRADLDRRFGQRDRWMRALVLVAGPSIATPPVPVPPSPLAPLTTGTLLMNSTLKVGLGLGAAALALTAVWTWTRTAERHDRTVEARPVAVRDSEREGSSAVAPLTTSALANGTREVLDAQTTPEEASGPIAGPCCVVGRVLDPSGQGRPGVRVQARAARVDRHALLADAPAEPLETASDERGFFSIELPPHRPFLLRAAPAGFAPIEAGPVFAGTVRDLRVGPGSRLEILVREEFAPIAGVRLEVSVASEKGRAALVEIEALTDAEGRATLNRLPGGTASIEAWLGVGPEMRRGSALQELDGENAARVLVNLLPTGHLEGLVRERGSREPIVGATVTLSGYASTTTDEEGRYALDGLFLGQSSMGLGARAPGFSAHYEYVQVDEARPRQSVDLWLEPALVVTGLVVDSFGRPVAGARLSWSGPLDTGPFVGESDRGDAHTDGAGRFVIDALHSGTPYRLLVRATGFGTGVFACGPLASGSGPRDSGTLELAPAGAIRGLVPEAVGSARPFQVKLLWGADDALGSAAESFSHLETTETDPAGRFAGLGAGRYRLEGIAPGPGSVARGRKGADPAPAPRTEVELRPGEERDGVRLESGGPLVEGTVRAQDGTPLGNCRLRLLAAEDETLLDETWASRSGRFRLVAPDPSRIPGPFRVEAVDPALFHEPAVLEPVDAGGPPLSITLFPFHSAYEIRGRLITPDGGPCERLFVAFTDTETGQRLARVALPEPDGTFVMRDLRDVPYDLEVMDFGDRYRASRLASVHPGSAGVELRLVSIE